MDLKISVFKGTDQQLSGKPCFNETIIDVPEDFGYSNLVLALKSVFGKMSIVQFFII